MFTLLDPIGAEGIGQAIYVAVERSKIDALFLEYEGRVSWPVAGMSG